ncbi:hypothetical protein GLYMA_02G176500v4 [Glycine max]|nr:hypothetical protein GLYMA_02G176500v4 [Glycine max]KAH1060848.1 hypothetical protein GYH30_004358 [Glycine max]
MDKDIQCCSVVQNFCVSDLLLLGRATIEESRGLLHWMYSEAGFSKMGICGLSMGGVHAAMVGSLHPTPVATFPFLSPHSAAVAFREGILKYGTAWEALRGDLATQKAEMTLEEVRERLRNDDGYIPKHSVLELQKAWPGSEVRWVTGGHVSSFCPMVNSEGLLLKALIDYRGRSLHCDRDIAQAQEIVLQIVKILFFQL